MITEIIKRAKKNPIITFGWTVFTLCIGYLVTHEATFPDRAAYFEKANIEISVSQMEYDRVKKLIEVYNKSNDKVTKSLETINIYLEAKLPKIADEDMIQFTSVLIEARREISKPIVLLRNSRFENESFRDMVHTLLTDAEYVDAYIAKRITFLELIRTDITQAEKMKASLKHDVEEERRLIEISSRAPLLEYYIEKARQEYNAKLRTAQRNEKLYKLRSMLAIGAWTYIGGFIGAWVGFMFSRRNRRNKASVSTTPESGTEKHDTNG